MNLELDRPQRTVEYFGLNLVVPFDTAYLSTDAYGTVVAHSEYPWYEPDCYEGYELGDVAKVKVPEGFDWRDTLRAYTPEEI